MSEFGDGSYDQGILDGVKMFMGDENSDAAKLRAIRAMSRISSMWLEYMDLDAATLPECPT